MSAGVSHRPESDRTVVAVVDGPVAPDHDPVGGGVLLQDHLQGVLVGHRPGHRQPDVLQVTARVAQQDRRPVLGAQASDGLFDLASQLPGFHVTVRSFLMRFHHQAGLGLLLGRPGVWGAVDGDRVDVFEGQRGHDDNVVRLRGRRVRKLPAARELGLQTVATAAAHYTASGQFDVHRLLRAIAGGWGTMRVNTGRIAPLRRVWQI